MQIQLRNIRLFIKVTRVTAKKHVYMFSTRTKKNSKNHLSTPQNIYYYLLNKNSVSKQVEYVCNKSPLSFI